MEFPIQTLSQLRPILVGFRKSAGLTQAQLANRLGVTQQTYAQLESDPAVASVERLFKVLSMLEVGLVLTQAQRPLIGTPPVSSPTSAKRASRRRDASDAPPPRADSAAPKQPRARVGAAASKASPAENASTQRGTPTQPRVRITKREDW